jgi:hypothetical protein
MESAASRISQYSSRVACFKTICFFCRDQVSKVRGATFNLLLTRDKEVAEGSYHHSVKGSVLSAIRNIMLAKLAKQAERQLN